MAGGDRPDARPPAGRISLDRLDHLVLTVRDLAATCDFYRRVLGMEVRRFGEGRTALHFGRQKINLHPFPSDVRPLAASPTPGSADLCFVAAAPLDAVIGQIEREGVEIELGPVERSGATGTIRSVYLRDPDGNLIEICNYL